MKPLNNNRKQDHFEVLAPVGGQEQLTAAVRCGADAVYLGLESFNARRNAENFTLKALPQVVSYCHARGVQVHITLNTVLFDSEMKVLPEVLEGIAQSGADAVIVQDLGVAKLVQRCCPTLKLHASTQMAIHNEAGARAAEELGFSRVVLARELTLEEIRRITGSVSIETEVFVHGALCTCMSGLCYFSAMLGGRSGNRGLCAQPCRLNFTCRDRSYALSLKDMSHVNQLLQLAEAGVTSFKIEGRMKRPEYVAAAVTACRKVLAGERPDMAQLKEVFSRGGFTDGYFYGKRNLSMYGRRDKEDVEATAKVLGSISELYRHEFPKIPVQMELTVQKDAALLLAKDPENAVTVQGDVPAAAPERQIDRDYAARFLQKTGGTPFYAEDIQVQAAP